MNNTDNGQEDEKTERSFKEAQTVTDLCYHEGESEVHLISLLEERIPRYTLRADTMTNFAGYENEDWTIRTPCLPSDLDSDLSIEVMEDTLKYFILGGARLSHVTKTYNDSRALTLLLEEKERDLEIASEIGRILVKKVRHLNKTVERLTEETEMTRAQVFTLQKELTTRDLLLQVYVKDFDSDSETEENDQKVTSFKLSTVDTEALRRRVRGLQFENDEMGSAIVRMELEVRDEDHREDQLIADCIEHLSQTNCTIEVLREQLEAKTELMTRQRDELNTYVQQILTLEGRSRQLNEDLRRVSRRVVEAEEEKQLAVSESGVWRRRYGECLSLLQAAQDEMKILRKAQSPSSVIHRNYSCSSIVNPFLPIGSLASELHDSQRKNLFYHFGFYPSATNSHSRKVMDVAKVVCQASSHRCLVASESQIFTVPDGQHSSPVDRNDDVEASFLESQCGSSGHISLDLSELIEDMPLGTTQNQRQATVGVGNSSLGQPGLPGSNDLEMALIRLNSPATFQSSSQNDVARRSYCYSPNGYTESRQASPTILAEESRSRSTSVSSESEQICVAIRKPTIPEKLLIVKPLGGSTTLNQWKILSIPNLDGFLEIRPGVQTRGQPLVPHFEDEIFCLSDYEEDGIPVVSQMLLDSPSRNSKTSCCNSDSSQYEPNESSRAANRRHSCIPNLTTETLYPFYDFGPRTLPDIVTRETIPIGGTQMPKPSCKVM